MLSVNEKHGQDRMVSSGSFTFVTALHGHLHESATVSGRPKATWKSNSAWTALGSRVHYGDVGRPPFSLTTRNNHG